MGGWVAVLTAAPRLSDATIAEADRRLKVRFGRRSVSWAETPLARPPDLEALRADLGADLNLVPAQRRRKRILIADMDGTMIGVECIDELADFAGVKAQVAAITERAMRGELDFEAAIDARVGLLADLPVATLQDCYDQRVRLNPGARALVQTMRAGGARTALVSGGFTFFTERVAAAAGFESHAANVLLEACGRLTGAVAKPVLGQAAKREALETLCRDTGATPHDVVAVGDGANDLAMIRAAGLGVAYRAKPALRAEADAILDHSDLTAVLALQGRAAAA
ncbi:MAG: phosphoserine phosphatase SerB [Pseudomonadota bacterium]